MPEGRVEGSGTKQAPAERLGFDFLSLDGDSLPLLQGLLLSLLL